MSVSEMNMCIERFKAELPSLAHLIERCEKAGRDFGYFLAVDGRWGRVRKKFGRLAIHTVLNVLLQMTGSLCMKWSQLLAEDRLYEEGVMLDESGHPNWVANVHDEWQAEVRKDEVEEINYTIAPSEWKEEEKRHHEVDGKLYSAPKIINKTDTELTIQRRYHRAGQVIVESFREGGKFLKMRVPLDGEYMIADNWKGTH